MLKVTHKRRTRRAIAQVAVVAILGVLLLTPKQDDNATATATHVTPDTSATRLLYAEQRK